MVPPVQTVHTAALSAAFAAAASEIDCELQGGDGYLTAFGCPFVLGMAAHSAAKELEGVFDTAISEHLATALARAATATW